MCSVKKVIWWTDGGCLKIKVVSFYWCTAVKVVISVDFLKYKNPKNGSCVCDTKSDLYNIFIGMVAACIIYTIRVLPLVSKPSTYYNFNYHCVECRRQRG